MVILRRSPLKLEGKSVTWKRMRSDISICSSCPRFSLNDSQDQYKERNDLHLVLDDHEWILHKAIHRVEDEIDDRANRGNHTRLNGHRDDIDVLPPMVMSS